jgi:hypothetical protein
MYTQDINSLTISGHVIQPPKQLGDEDVEHIEFVLTHTTHAYDRHGWEQHHYNVSAHDRLARACSQRHQPGQVVVITGELDLQIQGTLIGPLPYVSIVAHRIITVDGPLNPAASAVAPTTAIAELQHTAIGPVPRHR